MSVARSPSVMLLRGPARRSLAPWRGSGPARQYRSDGAHPPFHSSGIPLRPSQGLAHQQGQHRQLQHQQYQRQAIPDAAAPGRDPGDLLPTLGTLGDARPRHDAVLGSAGRKSQSQGTAGWRTAEQRLQGNAPQGERKVRSESRIQNQGQNQDPFAALESAASAARKATTSRSATGWASALEKSADTPPKSGASGFEALEKAAARGPESKSKKSKAKTAPVAQPDWLDKNEEDRLNERLAREKAMSKLTPIQRQLLELKAKNSELAPSTQASRASALGSSSGSPAEKSIDMSWVIDRGDLERKLAQVRTWLRTGLRVKVTVKAPRKDQRRVSTDEARALVAKIEAAAREGAIPDGGSSTLLREPRPRFGQLGGQLMMWFVGPPPAKSAEKKKR